MTHRAIAAVAALLTALAALTAPVVVGQDDPPAWSPSPVAPGVVRTVLADSWSDAAPDDRLELTRIALAPGRVCHQPRPLCRADGLLPQSLGAGLLAGHVQELALDRNREGDVRHLGHAEPADRVLQRLDRMARLVDRRFGHTHHVGGERLVAGDHSGFDQLTDAFDGQRRSPEGQCLYVPVAAGDARS